MDIETATEASIPSADRLPLNVFVYGTLMNGLGNHGLLKECEFKGAASTRDKYAMFGAGVPFVSSEIQRTLITGEVYEVVNAAVLEALDRLEGHPDWYTRTRISVILSDSSEEIEAYIYFNDKVSDLPTSLVETVWIESGNFRDAAKFGNPGSH